MKSETEIAPAVEDALHTWWIDSDLRVTLMLNRILYDLADLARLAPAAVCESNILRAQLCPVPDESDLAELGEGFAQRAKKLSAALAREVWDWEKICYIHGLLNDLYEELCEILGEYDFRWSVALERGEKIARFRVRVRGFVLGEY